MVSAEVKVGGWLGGVEPGDVSGEASWTGKWRIPGNR